MSAPEVDAPVPDPADPDQPDPGQPGQSGQPRLSSTIPSVTVPAPTSTKVHLVAAALALILAAGLAALDEWAPAVLVVVAVAQGLLILAVSMGSELPGRTGGLVLASAAAIASDAVLMRWTTSALDPLIVVLALVIPAMFVHQLLRGTRRVALTASLSGVAALILCVVSLVAWLQLDHEVGGERLCAGAALATGVALAVALLVDSRAVGPRVDVDASPTVAGLVAGAVLGTVAGGIMLHQGAGIALTGAIGASAGLAVLAVLLGAGMAMALVPAPNVDSAPAPVVDGPVADAAESPAAELPTAELPTAELSTALLLTKELPTVLAVADEPADRSMIKSWAKAIVLVVPVFAAVGPVAYLVCLAVS